MKKLLFDIAKIITAVATIGGSALWFDAKFDKQEETLKDIRQEVLYINAEQSMMSADIQGIHDTLEEIEDIANKNTNKIESLNWAIRNGDNFTSAQLEEILNREFARNRVYNHNAELEFIPIE